MGILEMATESYVHWDTMRYYMFANTRRVANTRRENAIRCAEELGLERDIVPLFEIALTHSSIKRMGEDNQRLEFLGDRVLGLVIAEYLMKYYPSASEGELTRYFHALVSRKCCLEVAQSINLGRYLCVSKSEMHGEDGYKGRQLGDAMEAVIAAVYTAYGYERVRQFIINLWTHQINSCTASPDPKTSLQEILHKQGKHQPVYVVEEKVGPAHMPEFLVSVRIDGYENQYGKGSSRRDAERCAASKMLDNVRCGEI